MTGFLTINNNTKKNQFLTRSGSYSTHASKTGRSFLYDFALTEDQLLTQQERLRVLGLRKRNLSDISCQLKKDLNLNPNKTVSYYKRASKRKTRYQPDAEKFSILFDISEQLQEIEVEIKSLRDAGVNRGTDTYRKEFVNAVYELLDDETLDEIVLRTKERISE